MGHLKNWVEAESYSISFETGLSYFDYHLDLPIFGLILFLKKFGFVSLVWLSRSGRFGLVELVL